MPELLTSGRASGTTAAESAAQAVIDAQLGDRECIRVLEAGCGMVTRVRLPQPAYLVGLDLSDAQLARDERLTEKIHGDIQTHRFGAERFDLILCWNVLEHVPDPAGALANMAGALSPGGLLVLAVPNLCSVKGIVTKATPFAVHRLFYRLMGDRRPAHEMDQFPTFLRAASIPRRLCRRGEALGLAVLLCRTYEGPVQEVLRTRFRSADLAFAITGRLSVLLTAGRYDLTHSDSIVILQRPAERSPVAPAPVGARAAQQQ